MFVAVAAIGVLASWLGWNVQRVRDRAQMLSILRERNADMLGWGKPTRRTPFVWRILGAVELHQLNIMTMPEAEFTEEEFQRAKLLFPEMSVWRGNSQFSADTGGLGGVDPPPK